MAYSIFFHNKCSTYRRTGRITLEHNILGTYQWRREPRVGPGTAQILRISGFVLSRTGKENGTLFSGFSSDLPPPKKGLHRN